MPVGIGSSSVPSVAGMSPAKRAQIVEMLTKATAFGHGEGGGHRV
jgi:hypothetical protein